MQKQTQETESLSPCDLNNVQNSYNRHHHHHHHHKSVMELGHLLTRSGLTYPEASSKFYHDSCCQLGSIISLPWVICFDAFYLHVVTSFSCIPVICPKFVLFLTPLQFVHNSHKYWETPSDKTSESSASKSDFLASSIVIPGQCNFSCSREERMKASPRLLKTETFG